ncbi:hypothetical protein EBB59_08390 [Lysobacter pythonis]|uniref:Tetratricopeptide repeat protein n=1 Tax=Solilutibacter pythonis TaxID=2483112 RepID=A0A3M2HN64_9GAMM|nr:tetratricopeptide repeat protein [Lysobacter pythonis]RMH91151.1 hypothetical protein EBB59_08390 [Lysobacter pythonis]
MSPFIIFSLLLQIACAVHVVRSGRPLYWIFIILIGSFIGMAIYFLAEVLPELRDTRGGQRTIRRVRDRIDPDRHKRQASRQLDLADTPANRKRLAEESLARGDFLMAESQFRTAMQGLYQTDPDLMLGLAQAQFGLDQPRAARETLDRLITANPDFRSHEGHLLYARAVEACGEHTAALHEYEALVQGFPGEEARIRQAQLLEKMGHDAQAQALYAETLKRADLLPAYYRREQKPWIAIARQRHEG